MRSAVSVILSSPAPDPNMSRPDYDQIIHDHAALLILIRHLGEYFSKILCPRFYLYINLYIR